MGCYKPLVMYDTGSVNPDTGKRVMVFGGRLKEMLPIDSPDRDNQYIVPCNRCIGCRLDYAREWSNRMLLEYADNPNAIFVTLTYNNEHLPLSDLGYPSTSVRDCQLFFKRLRKHFKGRKIRYFLGAEYGPRTFRPHYHAVIFGLTLLDFSDLKFWKNNKKGDPMYCSSLFESIWQNGICTLEDCTKDACSYTARYMLKKLKGFARLDYDLKHIEPEFSLCSRRPGIGLNYLKNHPELSMNVSVFDGKETSTVPLPKKLLDKVLEIDPDQYYVLKALRRATASSSEYLEWMKTDMEYLDYLDMKETEAYNRIKGVAVTTRLDI